MEAPSITRTLNINKASQTIVWDNIEPKTYGDADFYLPNKTDKGLVITYSSTNENVAKIVNNQVQIIGAGNANITATQVGNENYNPANSITLPINISKEIQEITFNSLDNKIYGDTNFNLDATNNSGIVIAYESSNTNVATITGNIVTITGAGETYITASSVGNDNYFSANPVQQLLTVNKATQMISLDVISDKVYGDDSFILNAQNNTLLPITYKSSDPSKLYISGNKATILGAGTFTVTAEQTGTTNYLPISTDRTFTVKKAQLIISADNKEKIYGDENPALTYSFEGFKNGDSKIDLQSLPSILCTANTESVVGKYDITVTGADDNNYSFLYRIGKLNIKKALLSVKPNDETRKYGDKNPTFTVVYSGFKNNENTNILTEIPVAITNAKATSNTGEYDIIVSGGSAVNYDFNYQNGKLIIEKSTLTIVAEDKEREAGEANPTFTLIFYESVN